MKEPPPGYMSDIQGKINVFTANLHPLILLLDIIKGFSDTSVSASGLLESLVCQSVCECVPECILSLCVVHTLYFGCVCVSVCVCGWGGDR